jgi:hypothetical protein
MQILWYQQPTTNTGELDKTKNTRAQNWHEAGADGVMSEEGTPAVIADGVFHASPFAIAMQQDPNLQNTADLPFPGMLSENTNAGGEDGDTTSLKLGERGIINPLWQYNSLADPRTVGKAGHNYGRVYNSRIRPNNPIVFLQPGRPKFFGIDQFVLGGGGDADKLRDAVLDNITNMNDAMGDTYSVADFLAELSQNTTEGDPLKFYDFEPDFNRYKNYVNALMRDLMVRMRLDPGALSSPGGIFGTTTDPFTEFMQYYGFTGNLLSNVKNGDMKTQASFIPFRVEKSSDAGDSFNTETGQSSVADQIKGIGDQAKEVAFLTGGNQMGTNAEGGVLSGAANAAVQAVSSALGAASGTTASVIKTGGNILFPEIWKDSKYSHNITLNIKLHAPNGNMRSYYETVLFPLCCVIGFILPRQTGLAVFGSPPLVRCYSKGWFSCDLGMVESVSIRRGSDTNDWTVNRLPRTVEISITIKDLFGTLMMSLAARNSSLKVFHDKNTALRDYLNVLGGVDVFSSNTLIERLTRSWGNLTYGFQTFFDPRTFITNMAANPVLGPAAKVVAATRGFFN